MTTYATLQTRDTATARTKSPARYLPTAARVALGLVFFVFGLMGLLSALGVIPMGQPSTPLPEGAAAFTAAVMKTGYLFALVKGTETVAGALLLSNRFVPLALALVAPVVVNIVAFHAFLEPSGLGLAAVVLAAEVYLAWAYRRAYRPMLAMRATPGTPEP
jgi:uncharacterized membrane protein YphA (DoxX/SURF4 family)